MKNNDELINQIFFKKYKILRKIGKGSFGSVYIGKNINTEQYYAVKFEQKSQQEQILERESYLLYYLRGYGIPEIITYGHNSKYNILVQTLLGNSITHIFLKNFKKFSMKDCCMIGIQILDRLEYIHSKNIIHRDVKPDNFLVGNPDKSIIYIIDFGLGKKFISSRTGKHVKFSISKKWSGTSRFASANSLRGVAQSRRDDLESLCYTLLYLMKGNLPWDNVYGLNENEDILLIYKIKKYMKPELLFMNLPKETAEFFKYCKKLEFEQKPDYDYLRGLLWNILNYNNERNDLNFSWINKIEISSYNLDRNKFKISKRKNSPRQRLYNSLINKKINLVKRSESFNKVFMDNIENKLKNNNLLEINNININKSPNHVNYVNNLQNKDNLQKYKYIKKIPKGKGKIIIKTNRLNKNLSTQNPLIEKKETQNENLNKAKINIIPLKNVEKNSRNSKIINNKKTVSNNFIVKKLNEVYNKIWLIKNNSFNFKDSKKLKLLNCQNNSLRNIKEHNNIITLNKIDLNNSKILKNSSFNNKKFFKNFSLNEQTRINNRKTINENSFNSGNKNNIGYFKIHINKSNNIPYKYHSPEQINKYKHRLKLKEKYNSNYLNIFNNNKIPIFKKPNKINLTNNNIQNNYNINIDINNITSDKSNQINKNKKDIKIINIISPLERNSFYKRVKKNSYSSRIPKKNPEIFLTNNNSNFNINESFNTYKNDLFENYHTNANIIEKYYKMRNKYISNRNNKLNLELNLNDNSNNNKEYRNSSNFIKSDIRSYNEKRYNSCNSLNSYKYVSPKSVEKYKNKY